MKALEEMSGVDPAPCAAGAQLDSRIERGGGAGTPAGEYRSQLEAEQADARLLQHISTTFIHEGDVDALYLEVLETAMALMRADCGSFQMLHPERRELQLIASKGFAPTSTAFWKWVDAGSRSACGEALRTGARIILPDVEACEFMRGTRHLEESRASGIRSVQSTPLFSRSGEPLGMISTHWSTVHQPADRELRLFDVLARQAADLIERAATARQVRHREQHVQLIADATPALISYIDRDLRYQFVNHRYQQWFGVRCDEVVGQTMEHVLGAAAIARLRPHLDRVLRGEDAHFEAEVPYRHGGTRWIDGQYVADRGPDGAVQGFFALVVDVTERKRTEAVLAEHARQRDALYAFAERLQAAETRTQIYDAALQAIIDALRCQRASVLLFDEAGVMRFVGWRNLSEGYRRVTEGHSPWRRDERHPAPVRMEDLDAVELSDELRATIRTEGIASLAFIPLVANGGLIGKFMAYFDAAHAFSADEIGLAQTLARHLSSALERRVADEKLKQSERRFREMIDALPAAVYTTDAQGFVTHFNPAAVELSGRLPELGSDRWCVSWKLLHPDGSPMRQEERPMAVAISEERPVRNAEAILERPDGSRRWFAPYPTPLRDEAGRVIGGINMLVDITERKQVEEALRDADRRKDEFLAMLAHELRNPLAPITNAVHLMRRARIEDPVQQQASAMIDRQASRLTRLVDDLLEVSRITTGRIQLHLERIELGGVIERAIESSRELIEQHRHTLTVAKPSAPVWLYADAARLEQVLVNLLNNAAKYTNDGGRIELKVRAEERQATISVHDTGVGIEPELLPRIFDLFTQAQRTLDRSQGGLGIGLSLVQRLVAMHGGAVEAKSVVGQGSEFIVRLPTLTVAQSPDAPAIPPTPRDVTAQALRVVIVDDNVDAAQSLGMLLEGSGHAVRLAHSGEAALLTVREHRPQIVLLDIGLPQIDGYEVAKRLRRLYPREAFMLVAMTGYGQAADRERSRAAGFDHHLVKPADYAELERILSQAARRARPDREP